MENHRDYCLDIIQRRREDCAVICGYPVPKVNDSMLEQYAKLAYFLEKCNSLITNLKIEV